MEGYIKLYRELIDKPIWLKSTAEQKAVLITLLLLANHEIGEWEWKGEKFKVFPGQFVTSLDSIKDKTGRGISIQNVRSSLNRFEKLHFLTNKATKSGRVITIINWDSYQPKIKNPTKIPTKTQQRPNKDPTPNNNDNNERMKEDSKKNLLECFNLFWIKYDKKIDKKKCESKFLKLKEDDINKILDTVEKYVIVNNNTKYRKNPLTYLHGECWNDEIIKKGGLNGKGEFKQREYTGTPEEDIKWLRD
jgi:hypothetical protein